MALMPLSRFVYSYFCACLRLIVTFLFESCCHSVDETNASFIVVTHYLLSTPIKLVRSRDCDIDWLIAALKPLLLLSLFEEHLA